MTFNEPVLLVAEFNFNSYDARAKSTARVLTVSVTEDGNVRVLIEAENPASNNLGFITISDATMSAEMYNGAIKPTLNQLKDLVIRKGSL